MAAQEGHDGMNIAVRYQSIRLNRCNLPVIVVKYLGRSVFPVSSRSHDSH